jgi:hypothetical protein
MAKSIVVPVIAPSDQLSKDMAENAAIVQAGGAKIAGQADKIDDAFKKTAQSTQTLTQAFRAQSKDVQRLAALYGETHPATLQAAQRAGELKDQIGDINTVVNAFSADSKFTAVAGAMQAAAGAAGIVTGAMGLLGVESKETEALLLKVQSAIALTQGLAALKEAGAAFTALNAVIKVQVIPSILAMNAATMIGVGAIVAAVAAVVTLGVMYNNAASEAEKLAEIEKRAAENRKLDIEAYNKARQERFRSEALEIRTMRDGYSKEHAELMLNKQKELAAEVAIFAQSNKNVYDRIRAEKNAAAIRAYYIKEEAKLREKYDVDRKKPVNNQVAPALQGQTFDQIVGRSIEQMHAKNMAHLDAAVKAAKQKAAELRATFVQLTVDMNATVEAGVEQSIATVASAIGEAFVNGKNAFENLGYVLLQSLGNVCVQLGTQMIAFGVSFALFKKSIQSLNPYTAIAAGAAMVAIGAAISAIAKKGMQPGGGGSTSVQSAGGGGGGGSSSGFRGSGFGGVAGVSSLQMDQIKLNGTLKGRDIQINQGRQGYFSRRVGG